MPLRNMKDPVDPDRTVFILLQSRAGNEGLDMSDGIQEIMLPARVKLGQDIIQQKDGDIPRGNKYIGTDTPKTDAVLPCPFIS